MKSPVVALLTVALLAPSTAFADEPTNPRESPFFARSLLGAQAGSTAYGLSFTQRGITAESDLDWPISFVLAGVEVGAVGRFFNGRRWGVTLSVLGGVAGPLGEITDRDWITGPGLPRTEFSHTDSMTTGSALIADLSAHIELSRGSAFPGSVSIDLIGGYRHEYYGLDAWGAHGWQLNMSGWQQPVSLPESVHALNYNTHKILPYVGIGLRRRSGRVHVDGELRVMFVVSIDVDDHVARNKLAEATSTGVGAMAVLRPRVIVSRPDARIGVSVGLDLQLRYLYAWGTLSQRYYANDPFISGATPATMIPDADFSVRSFAGTALATMDVSF